MPINFLPQLVSPEFIAPSKLAYHLQRHQIGWAIPIRHDQGYDQIFQTQAIAPVQPLNIDGDPVLTAQEGVAYDGFLAVATGGEPPYTYSALGVWPAGITVDANTGQVSGTPTESGSFPGMSVFVTDQAQNEAQLPDFTLEVAPA